MITVGIDEAGRGCWAGPLVAAAVILDKPIAHLNDSKKLTKNQRQRLAAIIWEEAIAVGTGWATAKEVDALGLTVATQRAMLRALKRLDTTYESIIIDGNYNYLPDLPNVSTMVKADALVPSVSAASIIAKTERDAYMRRMSARYPKYQFDKHVGYGTALHLQLLQEYGACKLHRLSYRPLQVLLEQTGV